MTQVVIESSNEWVPALVAAGVGLLGVGVGVCLATLFELWRRALDAQAAARLIRMESVENRVKVLERAPPAFLRSEAWDTNAPKIISLLKEMEASRIAESYAELSRIGLLIELEARTTRTAEGDRRLSIWVERAQANGKVLRAIESAKPRHLMWKLVKPINVASPEEIREEYGLADKSYPGLASPIKAPGNGSEQGDTRVPAAPD
jgi:hypothetical protein